MEGRHLSTFMTHFQANKGRASSFLISTPSQLPSDQNNPMRKCRTAWHALLPVNTQACLSSKPRVSNTLQLPILYKLSLMLAGCGWYASIEPDMGAAWVSLLHPGGKAWIRGGTARAGRTCGRKRKRTHTSYLLPHLLVLLPKAFSNPREESQSWSSTEFYVCFLLK